MTAIGIDLVAMNVNDIVVQGAEPLFFLDYFATGKLDLGVAETVIAGIAEGCQEAGCALIGGETAEMPGLYAPGDYDLAGFAVGAVERGSLLPRNDIAAGDVILALPSSGVHANGFSLVRRVVERIRPELERPRAIRAGHSRSARPCSHRPASMSGRSLKRFAEPAPSRRSPISPAAASPTTSRACCPTASPPRSTLAPSPCRPCSLGSSSEARLDEQEMLRTFNCGIGMIVVAGPRDARARARSISAMRRKSSAPLANAAAASRSAIPASLLGARRDEEARRRPHLRPRLEPPGPDRGLQSADYPAKIVLVISNVPSAQGLLRAEASLHSRAASSTTGTSPRAKPSTPRSTRRLNEAGVELLCNAGFMRLHTEGFVASWRDRHLNIHPSLLPAFKGLHTHARVLAEGVKITGCTVHFVRPEMDEGPIVAQAAVPVLPGDTADSLAARVLIAEHRLYPHALGLVASGAVRVEGERCRRNDTDQRPGPAFFAPPRRTALIEIVNGRKISPWTGRHVAPQNVRRANDGQCRRPDARDWPNSRQFTSADQANGRIPQGWRAGRGG